MENELVVRAFVIIKGFIDAKDERGNAIYGTLLSLTSRREMKYLSVMFSYDEPLKSMSWNELLNQHRNKDKDPGRNPMMIHNEEELYKYLRNGNTLSNVAKNHNTKQAEQSISRHCLDGLKLKTVSFIEYCDAAESDMEIFLTEAEPAAEPSNDEAGQQDAEAGSSDTEGRDDEKSDDTKAKDDIVVRCEPILAPVGGVAMNELSIGDLIMVQMPEDSVFFKLLSRNIDNFDGIVSAAITGILQNELGTATVGLSLADGVAGVLKLSGKVRIKTASTSKEQIKKTRVDISTNFIFGVAAGIVVIMALIVLYYIFR